MRIFGRDQLASSEVPVAENEESNSRVVVDGAGARNASISREGNSEKFTDNAQNGVLKIEATTTVWTKNALILAYIL